MKKTLDILNEELFKMRLRRESRIKTRYTKNDMQEEYGFDQDKYNREANFLLRSETRKNIV